MTKPQLIKQIETIGVSLGMKSLTPTEITALDRLISEYVAGVIPEKKDLSDFPAIATTRWVREHPETAEKWLNGEGFNKAIDEISRRAGIGEEHA